MNSSRRLSHVVTLRTPGTAIVAMASGSPLALSYALMNPRSDLATSLTPRRLASASWESASRRGSHLYFRLAAML